MGRPVFSRFELADAVSASRTICVGRFAEPRTRVDDATGAKYLCVVVAEILDTSDVIRKSMMSAPDLEIRAPRPLSEGFRIDVFMNRTSVALNATRRVSPSGASIPAVRYRTDPNVLEADALIFFLDDNDRTGGLDPTTVRDGTAVWALVADLAVETLEKRDLVNDAILLDRSRRADRRVSNAATLAHVKSRMAERTSPDGGE